MAHTQGPWTAETDGVSGVYWIQSNAHGDESPEIATVHSVSDIEGTDPMECRDNARLIAAAPDMLDALLAIRQAFFDGELVFTKKRQSADEPYHTANVKMCSAIDKATGEI